MLDTANTTEKEEGAEPSLGDRRLKSIGNGDLNWIGKGFLAVVKKDCEKPNLSKNQNNGFKN